MNLRTPVLQLGTLNLRTFRKAVRTLKNRGLGNHVLDKERVESAMLEASRFEVFLDTVVNAFQSADTEALRKLRAVPINPDSPIDELSQKYWNHYGQNFLIGRNYMSQVIAFQTILEGMRILDRENDEVILSLGSGFGIKEIYLANLFHLLGFFGQRVICLDSASAMVNSSRLIANNVRLMPSNDDRILMVKPLRNISHINASMDSIPLPDKSVGQIFCHDALQWVPDWRKAVDEMARVINPDGLRTLNLSVRIRPLTFASLDGTVIRRLGDFSVPELLDYLERRSFRVVYCRQISIGGSRQTLLETNDQYFVRAVWTKGGVSKSWRDRSSGVGIGLFS